MEPHEEDLRLAEEIGELISKRNLAEARQRGLERIGSRGKEAAAELAFQVALACSLLKDTTSMPWETLEEYQGFTARMAGDRLRDQALEAIREKRNAEAQALLNQARSYASRDQDGNRRLVLVYVNGRLSAARGHSQEAMWYYNDALTRWSGVQEPNQQWIQNCLFHRLELMARMHGPGRFDETKFFVKNEKSWKRRAAAWAFALLGGSGASLATRLRHKWA